MEKGAESAAWLNRLSGILLDAAMEVHRVLGGPGLLESIYEEAFVHEMRIRGLSVERQVSIPVSYKGQAIKHPLVLDLMVENSIILEIKSVEKFNPIFAAQLLTYLRLTQRPLGLVINFGERYLKNGFHRVVNYFPDS